MTAPRLYDYKDAAELLGVHPATVAKYVRDGHLRVVDLSTTPGGRGTYRIREDDIARFINKRTAAVKSA